MTPKEVADHLIQNRRACRTRRGHPCPVCGHFDNHCLRTDDGLAALCPKADGTGSVRRYGEYGHLYLLSGSDFESMPAFPPVAKKPERTDKELHALWAPRARHWWKDNSDAVSRLAAKLGVASWALDELRVGWDGKAWTFPERNADGLIVGVNRRFEDGGKRCATGSRRGLTYSDSWQDARGPVLIVEGGSDVASGITLNVCSVGRPSNVGGVPMLRKLLAPCDKTILVVGERDRKPDKRWPGMEGAKAVATQLSKALKRQVRAGLLPDGAKDLRGWLNSWDVNISSTDECAELGAVLLKRLG